MPDKIIHQIQVDGYCARFGGKWGRLQLGTFGSYGVEQLQISLGDSWADLVVYANFVTADGTTPVLVPESGLVDVPPEATAKPGMGNIVLDGTADGVRIYSVNIPYIMLTHSDLSGEAPAPTPDRWEQYVAQVQQYADSAKQSAAAAAESESNAAASEQAAQSSETAAAESEANAAQSATQAAASATAAQQSQNAAAQSATLAGDSATAAKSSQDAAAASATAAAGSASDAAASADKAAQAAGDVAGAVSQVQEAAKAALDDIATERETALEAVQTEGGKQQSAITSGGAAALEAIGRTEQAAIGQVQQAGQAQLDKIAAANALVPTPTQADAGKAIIVNPDGSGYELGEVQTDAYTKAESDARYAPIEAAIRPTVSGNPATLEHSVAWAMQGLNVYGKSTQQTTTGAQLFPMAEDSYSANGLTATKQSDGSYLVNGTPAVAYSTVYYNDNAILEPGKYYISSDVSTQVLYTQVAVTRNDKSFLYINRSFTIDGSESSIIFTVQTAGSMEPLNNIIIKPMLNAGSTALPWEPYTGGKPSPSPDYPQEIATAGSDGSIDITISDGADQSQQLSIQTPNGLPGIPVDSGGNYTDASGQQWVCDEVDFARGVYVQRIQKILGYSDESVLSPYMSTTGQLTTGATVIYVLAAPIETPLSAEELAAYAALRSYNGTTIVSTEAPVAELSARYVADGAAYIDSKIQSAVTQAVAAAVSLTGGAQ